MKTIIFLFIMALSSPYISSKASAQSATQQQIAEGKIQSSYVCFVNNKYLGKEQIPVEVEGKTYYGCCQGCVGNIKNNRKIRYTKDPLTGEEVDKATAYIVIKGSGSSEVFYFQNKENYYKYKKNASL